jgi:hypothetical protein
MANMDSEVMVDFPIRLLAPLPVVRQQRFRRMPRVPA